MITLKPWAYYNEIDDYAADWIENLIALGAVAPGIVDRRSIVDVRPDDLRGFRQAHFFAGVAVWSYALRRAGVSDDTALWTGSCPCQPFSAAGAGGGLDDERHLWPHWFHLILGARPPRIYGEQVASKDGLGWLDLVSADLEGSGYSIWTVDTCSAGSGAPHIRQRLRFCADDLGSSAGDMGDTELLRLGASLRGEVDGGQEQGSRRGLLQPERPNPASQLERLSRRLDDCLGEGLEGQREGHRPSTGQRQGPLRPVTKAGGIAWVADDSSIRSEHGSGCGSFNGTPGAYQGREAEWQRLRSEPVSGDCRISLVVNPDGGHPGAERQQRGWEQRQQPQDGGSGYRAAPNRPSPTNGFWRDADWLFCRDAKWRPVEPFTFPLVDRSAFRVGSGSAFEGKSRQGMLKGYGNAIDAEATIDFIEATLEPDTIEITVGADTGTSIFEDLLG